MSILGISLDERKTHSSFVRMFYTGNINASSSTSNIHLSSFTADISLKQVALQCFTAFIGLHDCLKPNCHTLGSIQ